MTVIKEEKNFALLGYPLGHSLSPQLHQLISASSGESCHYHLLSLPLETLMLEMPTILKKYQGLNVTIPYKKEIIPYLKSLAKEAEHAGAVNTIKDWQGYNTDIIGIKNSLPKLAGKKVLLLGNGGVAASIALVALEGKCRSLKIYGRDFKKISLFSQQLKEKAKKMGILCDIEGFSEEATLLKNEGFEIIMNGTAAGMWPNVAALPISKSSLAHLFAPKPFVFDAIYNPSATRFLLQAASYGCQIAAGIEMFFYQALEARKIWAPEIDFSKVLAEKETICRQLTREVWKKSQQKVLLTGFMGSGKTTIGQQMQKELGEDFSFWDLDDCIVQHCGKSIKKIFAEKGEAYFRAIEQKVLRELLDLPKTGIISLGGGALLSDEAKSLVRTKQALIIYLKTEIEQLLKRLKDDQERPLLQQGGEEEIKALYEQRKANYQASADLTLEAGFNIKQVTSKILKILSL